MDDAIPPVSDERPGRRSGRRRIALFATCLADTLYPDTARAVVTVLERLGHDVVFPESQTCCGQIHANTGYADEALALAARFVAVFADEPLIVSPSASCVAMVREHYPRLARDAGDERLAAAVDAIAPRVHELSALLVDVLGVDDVGAYYPHRVTLHPTCHGMRMLGADVHQRRLLERVEGLDLLPLEDERECCGFGGTFAVKNADVSTAMLSDKLRCVVGSGAEVCTAGDDSCLMQIGGGLRRQRAGVRAVHLARILASTREDPAA